MTSILLSTELLAKTELEMAKRRWNLVAPRGSAHVFAARRRPGHFTVLMWGRP
ncbi:hypothetical protein [Streptomyces sp. HC307]|uniref:hypothetical protein n=1 Tax=Streptomyces flavusporus TaxID=3385496 RepID=UPI003916D894